MFNAFEWMIAVRYLRARRAEGFISVIAWFSLVGIALGVATLIIVMAVMNGFRTELVDRILGLNGHISVLTYDRPITDHEAMSGRIMGLPGVVQAAPYVEGQVMITNQAEARGALGRGGGAEGLSGRAPGGVARDRRVPGGRGRGDGGAGRRGGQLYPHDPNRLERVHVELAAALPAVERQRHRHGRPELQPAGGDGRRGVLRGRSRDPTSRAAARRRLCRPT